MTSATKKILLLDNKQAAAGTALIAQQIIKAGHTPIILKTEEWGFDARASFRLGSSSAETKKLFIAGQYYALEQIDAIWVRPRGRLRLDDIELTAQQRRFCVNQLGELFRTFRSLAQQALWVSHPYAMTLDTKPRQLFLASNHGLRIPETLVSSDAEEIRAFYEEMQGNVIVKCMGDARIDETDTSLTTVYTNRLRAEHLDRLDDFVLTPAIFQKEIAKAYEIRTYIIGQQIISIKIDSQRSAKSALDWRRYDLENTPYTEYNLPTEVANKLRQLVQTLGLEYAGIDLIRDQDGAYIFLEVNDCAEFAWAEWHSSVKISAVIADLLVGNILPLKGI